MSGSPVSSAGRPRGVPDDAWPDGALECTESGYEPEAHAAVQQAILDLAAKHAAFAEATQNGDASHPIEGHFGVIVRWVCDN